MTQENYQATFIVSKVQTKSTASESSGTLGTNPTPSNTQVLECQHKNGYPKPLIPSPCFYPYVMTTIDYMTSIYRYISYLEWILLECRIKKIEAGVLRKILNDCKEILNQLEYAKKHFTNDTEKGDFVKRSIQLLHE
jgi:hypothetical protein